MSSRLRILGLLLGKRNQELNLVSSSTEITKNPHPTLDGGNLFIMDNTNQMLLENTIHSSITNENNITQGKEPLEDGQPLLDESKDIMPKKEEKVEDINNAEIAPQTEELKTEEVLEPDLLIKEDIETIKNEDNKEQVGEEPMATMAEINAQLKKEDDMLDQQFGGVVSSNPEVPVTAQMRRERTEKKLAKAASDKQIKELEQKIKELESEIGIMTEELAASDQEVQGLVDQLNSANQQISGAKKSFYQEEDIAFELLASAGIPSDLPDGNQMSVSDAIMYLLDQHSITSSTVNSLRNDLRKLAYKWRRDGRKDDADYMFEMLAASSKQGSFIAVSSNEE